MHSRSPCRSSLGFEHLADAAPRGMERWRNTKHNSGSECDEHGKGESSEIRPDVFDFWYSRRRGNDREIHDESKHGSAEREENAFGEQLPNHAPARRAERKTDGDLVSPTDGRADHESADIGADNRHD